MKKMVIMVILVTMLTGCGTEAPKQEPDATFKEIQIEEIRVENIYTETIETEYIETEYIESEVVYPG